MSQVSEIVVKWSPETSGRVASIQIQSRIAGQAEWGEVAASFDPTVGEFRFTANAPATKVEVRARFRNTDGVFGPWLGSDIITASAVVEYDTITGLPTKLADLNPAEGGKLGGIEPGATVGAIIGGNVKNPDGTLYVPVTTDYSDIRESVEQDITDALNDAKAGLQTEISGVRTDVSNARGEISTAVSGLTVSIADAKKAGTDASAAVVQARADLTVSITAAKKAGTDAAADAKKASDDLALEVSRAKGAEGTITTDLGTVRTTANKAAADVSAEATVRADADVALGNRTSTVEAKLAGTQDSGLAAKIRDEATARVDAVSAVAGRVSTTEAKLAGTQDSGIAALIRDESTARATADNTISGRVSTTEAQMRGEQDSTLAARIRDEATARTTAVDAVAVRVSTTEAKLNGTQDSAVAAAIRDEATTRVNADSALSGRVSTTEAKLNGDQDSKIAANLRDEATARVNADSALSGRVSTTEAQFRGEQDSILAGRIRDEATTRADAVSAIAGRTTTIESQYAGLGKVVGNEYFDNGIVGWDGLEGATPVASSYGRANVVRTSPGVTANGVVGRRIAITSDTQRFKLKISWRCAAATAIYYFGVQFFDANNNGVAAVDGTGNYPLGPSVFADSAIHGWIDREVIIGKGVTDASPWGGTRNIPAGAVYMRPIMFLNYTGTAGSVSEVDYFVVEDVTAAEGANARITEEATTRTNADSALSTRATNLETSVNNGATGNLALQGKITDEASTRSTADSALATRATVLEASATNTGNLVPNTAFVTTDGWFLNSAGNGATLERNRAGSPYQIGGVENNLTLWQSPGASGLQAEALSEKFAVRAGEYYQVQALTASHRARAWVSLFFYDAGNNFTGYAGENSGLREGNGGQSIEGHDITGSKSYRAPAGTVAARVAFRMYDVTGDGYAWFHRPYVGVVKANTDQWNAYSPGSDRTTLVQTLSRISTEETTRTNADSALATRATNLETSVNNGATGNLALQGKITDEATSRVNADSALVTRANNLEATVFSGPNQNTALSSRITDETTARTNADSALATRSNTLESKMEGNAASGLQTLIKNNRKNLIDLSWWKIGAGIPWVLNGGQRNEIVSFPHGGNFDSLPMPDGSSGDAWLCQADASGGAAGGWQSTDTVTPLDPDKTYRFCIPIAQLGGAGSRTAYWGTDGICVLNTTTQQDNPYFAVLGNMTPNRWHLFVGYVYPRNSTAKTHDGAGVWDMVTGERLTTGQNYCFRPDGVSPRFRAYQYYAYNGSYQAFGRPMVELVDGTETPFPATLAAAKGVTAANARINDEQTTRANADSALATRANTLEAQFRGETDSTIAARIRDEATTRSNADSGLANRVTVTEASTNGISSSAILNDRFANWPNVSGLPFAWVIWNAEGSYRTERWASNQGSPYAIKTLNDSENVESGFYQTVTGHAGKWVCEVTAQLNANTLSGAGVTVHGQYNLDFMSEPDTLGRVGDAGTAVRSWTKIWDFSQAFIDSVGGNINVHAMHSWTGFGRYRAPKYVTWYRLSLRPAGPGDIAGVKNASDIVSANARIGNEETARATAVSAIAGRTSVVEAQVSNDSNNMLRNGTFNAPGWGPRGQPAYPPYWYGWANDNGGFIGPANRDSRYGATAPLQIDRQGIQNGLTQTLYNVAPGWYVMEVDMTGEDGNWSGSGIHCNFNNGYAFNYGFAVNGDSAGRFGDIGTANRQFSYMFYNGADSAVTSFYLMAGWSGFQGGTNFGFFRYVCHRVVFRPATAGEIAARKVEDSNIIARVSSTESTVANINGKTQAYFSKTASVPGAEAFIVAQAINDSGQATSSVAIGGNSIALYNNADGSTRRAMYLAGGNATFDGFITARSGIRIGDGQWSIAVAPKDFGVSNGQAVSYGYDLGRIATVTFGACPVALNAGEVYRAYATNNTSTGFTAVCEIVSAPSSSNQSVGPGYSVNGAQAFDVGKGTADATNGIYNFAVSGTIQAYAYNDGGGINCVHIDSWLTDDLQAGDAQVGDPIMVLTEHRETWEPALVERSYVAESYCVRITTSSGIKLTLSEDAPITLRDGREIWVREVLNEEVAVLDDGAFRWEPVLNIEEIGVQPIARLSCWSGTYAAGDEKGRMIFTHNINKQ